MHFISRRTALLGLAASAACGPAKAGLDGAGPIFSATGPDAERYGVA